MPNEISLNENEINRLNEIKTQQMRVAVDLTNQQDVQMNRNYFEGFDEDFYKLSLVKEENSLIKKALSKNLVDDLNLTSKERAHFRNIKSRNKAHILLNQQKFSGDSTEMGLVKSAIRSLELTLPSTSCEDPNELTSVENQYETAIKACRNYEEKKNPWFSTGKERKKLVTKRRIALEKELICFRLARNHMPKKYSERPQTALELLELGRELMEKGQGGVLEQSHKDISKKKEQLLDSKVTHFGIEFSDSERMTNVKNSITALNKSMVKQMPADLEGFSNALEQIRSEYRTMIENCQTYVNYIESKKKGSSDSGKERLELTRQILSQSKKELVIFEMPAKELFGKFQGTLSWHEILYSARAIKISILDDTIEEVGQGTSTVYKKTDEKGNVTYIKAEERIAENGSTTALIQRFGKEGGPEAAEMAKVLLEAYEDFKIIDQMDGQDESVRDLGNPITKAFMMIAGKTTFGIVRQKGESDKDYSTRVEEHRKSNVRKAMDVVLNGELRLIKDYVEEHYDTFVEVANYVEKKKSEFMIAVGDHNQAGIEAGEVVSNRNVSTSRMAERYGMSDMIAKSETVIIEKQDGTFVKGNSMEEVKGKTMGELMTFAKAEGITLKFSPNAIKQLLQLNVFDMICGQVDRHMNNYIPSFTITGENEYTITSIKGIDNDLAFGSQFTKLRAAGRLRTLIDKDGNANIPFLPMDFYNRVMEYSPEMAANDQKDIRSEAEVNALGARIREVQKQLKKLVNEGKLKLLKTEEEWKQAIEELKEMKKVDKLPENYIVPEMLT